MMFDSGASTMATIASLKRRTKTHKDTDNLLSR
jgi:hypothetical protein